MQESSKIIIEVLFIIENTDIFSIYIQKRNKLCSACEGLPYSSEKEYTRAPQINTN